jgi:hypothetical protein
MSADATPSANQNGNIEQVKLLFDYTKFHIGLYTTLASVLIAAFASAVSTGWHVCRPLIACGIAAIALAGLFGGIVASSLPYFTASSDVYKEKTGPLTTKWFSVQTWTYFEHVFFWLAVICVLLAFLPVVLAP